MRASLCIVGLAVAAMGCAEVGGARRAELPPAEAALCRGDVWRGAAVVLGPEAVRGVEPLYATLSSHGSWQPRLRGATIRLRPIAGVDEGLLAAMIDCHRRALADGVTPPVAGDPYGLPDERMRVEVEAEASGLVVQLSCDDLDDAKRVLARACAFGCSAAD
jgi:hypothetical protein